MERTHHLRVLIANERADRLAVLGSVVTGLGHEVIASEIHVSEVAAVTARDRPDVALVGLGKSSEHALQLITEIVRGAFCPVIALLRGYDAEWIDEAAKRGAYAYIVDTRPEELQSAIEITLRRFAELQEVQGAFDRRNAQAALEATVTLSRRRNVLELHDGVVQALTVAKLGLDLDQPGESRKAVLVALENAQAIVGRAMEEMRDEGVSLEQLIRDAAPAGR
ncbi:MAG: two-component system, response regulator PdtaR [Gaiellaceae bacterium]|nr:two-component system, response regulator PdtaR [Gaiellaceae bacterium]MDX6470686.1 two-component system, response regulator PdtaR [Gaiellaceae bacterium]MDX6473388.1 two-component system, response regulator PdtaR [Gaiellaceae bacterium]